MLNFIRFSPWILAIIFPVAVSADQTTASNHADQPLSFKITFDPALQPDPYTGRVYIMLSQRRGQQPRYRINSFQQWMKPAPVFARNVKTHDPTEPIIIDAKADHYPYALAELPHERFFAQAVARRNLDSPRPGMGVGDLYSDTVELDLTEKSPGQVSLALIHEVKAQPPKETDRTKIVDIVGGLSSCFYQREVKILMGVRLPAGWKPDSKRKYPVLYVITGFGGNASSISTVPMMLGNTDLLDQMLVVVPDATCYRGHNVFADSQNNGPVGQELTDELIPYIEEHFGGAMSPQHRYVTGMSSGGWSSLWLQITYPDFFNGCWSDVPDPVDFRDFQQINLYAPNANVYTDKSGARRPLMRNRDKVMIYYEDFVKAEQVLGPGGQIQSFEAVFSPKGPDGEPLPLFDRQTGAVDPAVAHAWQRYDIRRILEKNWATLGPKLKGKLHIYAGQFDNFYLEGAVRLLKTSLEKLGSDAVVEVVSGRGHGTMFGPRARPMLQTIVDNFNRQFPEWAPKSTNAKPTSKTHTEAVPITHDP